MELSYRLMPLSDLCSQDRKLALHPHCGLKGKVLSGYMRTVDLFEGMGKSCDAPNYQAMLDHLRAGIVEDKLVSRFVEAGGWYSAEVVFAVRSGYPRFALAIATNARTRLGEEWVGSNHQGTRLEQ